METVVSRRREREGIPIQKRTEGPREGRVTDQATVYGKIERLQGSRVGP